MNSCRQTFALYFGNRGFFPESLIASARTEMVGALSKLGFDSLVLDAGATRYGAVETPEEGAVYARFLAQHRGAFDGVVLCLPNFGDETGAIAALRDCGVPILVQAYPDELDKMDFANRRDAFCGKFSVLDVFAQYGLACTSCEPHVCHPLSATFAEQMTAFAATCRVAGGVRRMTVGALGARTSAFKTVRFDELALEKHGITTETVDLSEVIERVHALGATDERLEAKKQRLAHYTCWDGVPAGSIDRLARLGVVIDALCDELHLDALALRCWLELEKQLKVSPCVLLSELNDRGMPSACELDVCNAVAMRALSLASNVPSACLDWNNNYGDDPDRCILFHCGPVAQTLMSGTGKVIDHPMFAKALGPGCGFGCNVGRIAPMPMSFASAKTENGRVQFYVGEGQMTPDPIPPEFFGCAGVAHINGLPGVLRHVGEYAYRHHVSITRGHVAGAVAQALERYCGHGVTVLTANAGSVTKGAA